MVVLDTTFIIELLRKKGGAVEKSKALPSAPSTTRINVFEVLVGVYSQKLVAEERALEQFFDFLSNVKILELDEKSADRAARMSAELRTRGRMVSDSDVLIAAIALANGEGSIITQNVKDFSKINGIKVEPY